MGDPPDFPVLLPMPLSHEPETSMVRIVVRMPVELYNTLYAHVTEHRTTMSAFGRTAILEKMRGS